jgi:16S rRNA (guanine966-N2)-methyltransferase
MLRIIAGKYRNRLLKQPFLRDARPSKQIVREAIFSALDKMVEGRVIADLFGGSGAMAIEAISRGARHAYIAEINPRCIAVIKQNISSLNIENIDVMLLPYQRTLKRLSNLNINIDIMFLDPPYKDKDKHLIPKILQSGVLSDNGIIVMESDAIYEIDERPFSKVRRYRYGRSHVTIMWR